MHKRLIIFDWDGTLVDSSKTIVRSIQQTACQMGLKTPPQETIQLLLGLNLSHIIDNLFSKLDESSKENFITSYLKCYENNAQGSDTCYKNVYQSLYELRRRKILLAVATNKTRFTLTISMEVTYLKDFFTTTICAEQAEPKPNPLMIEQILMALQTNPEHAILVGDSILDMETAHNAGIDAIAVTHDANNKHNFSNIPYVIKNFEQLIPYVL